MGKDYLEKSLKRFLKGKVKITLGLVVTFMITGTALFAEDAAEGTVEWHKQQAEKYLAGLGEKGIELNEKITAGNVTIESDGAEGIKITNSDKEITILKENISSETLKNLQTSLNLVTGKGEIISSDALGFNEGLKLEDTGTVTETIIEDIITQGTVLMVSGKENIFVNNDILTMQQRAELGAVVVNKGKIINQKNTGQYINTQSIGYNYGIIANTDDYGQDTAGIAYNYGIIMNAGKYGQNISGIGYNYSIIANMGDYGQNIAKNGTGYNYGIIINTDRYGQNISGIGYNYGIIANTGDYGQYISGTGYNYGIIINTDRYGQNISGIGYNYGTIINTNDYGQNISGIGYNYNTIMNTGKYGQNIAKNGTGYNYGTIMNTNDYGQNISGIGYNYNTIMNTGKYGQSISGVGYNYGSINNTDTHGQNISGTGYNYGTIANTGDYGQNISGTGIGYNYGIIANAGDYGQFVSGTGTGYNYGIITNTGKYGIYVKDNTAQAKNYGIIDFKENSNTGIFYGNVENNGFILTTTDNLGKLNLGTGKNSGVVLDDTFELKQTGNGEVNNHVTGLTSGEKVIETGKTYYTYNGEVTISENINENKLKENVLTAVITSEDKTAYKYTGKDELILEDSTVMGYFTNGGTGTLLDVIGNVILVNSIINVVTDIENSENIAAVKLDGGTLTVVGDSQIVGTVTGKGGIGYVAKTGTDSFDIIGDVILKNDNDNNYGMTDKYTDVVIDKAKASNLVLDFAVEGSQNINKVVLNNAVLNSINGRDSKEVIDLTINNLENISGNIILGENDDILTVTNSDYAGIIDMGIGNDTFNVKSNLTDDVFDYIVNNTETINLNGKNWYIGENAKLNGKETTLNITGNNTKLYVDINNNYGTGNATTSLDKMIEGTETALTVTTDSSAIVKFTVGNEFNVNQKQFDVAENYELDTENLEAAVIFKGTGEDGKIVKNEEDGDVTLIVKEASEFGLETYGAIYNAVLNGLSGNEGLINAINHQDEEKFVEMIETAGETAEALYTTGYAVTKDVADTYMSVSEDFGRKAGKGEWLAYGKYIDSDTEFDGGNKSKGYDGDITGTVGMLEYGINDSTSFGVIYGQGDTEVDIKGGGKLDGDNRYFGAYVKHNTHGIDLVGNIGYAESELDLSFASNAAVGSKVYQIITDGHSDADALTFSLKGKKDYEIYDGVKLQPVAGIRYTRINQDEITSSDASYRMSEQDVDIFEGSLGVNLVKEFNLESGRLAFSVGAEYVHADINADDTKYTLYGQDIKLADEGEIADDRIEAHIGAEYIHESGVGFGAKYEAIFTDKGDSSRVSAGVSYKF